PPRGSARSHWPFKFGYFVSSNACATPIVSRSDASRAATRIELRASMAVLALGDTLAGYEAISVLSQFELCHASLPAPQPPRDSGGECDGIGVAFRDSRQCSP